MDEGSKPLDESQAVAGSAPLESAPHESTQPAFRIARNAGDLLASRIVSAVVALAATPFLFSMLGARQFGLWAILLGTVTLAGLADLGFGSAQVREVAQGAARGDLRRARAACALALLVYGGISVLLLAFVWLGWPAVSSLFHLGDLSAGAQSAAFLLVGAFALDSLATPWRAALEGHQQMRPIALAGGAGALLNGGLGVALVAAGAGLSGLGWAVLAASALRALLLAASAYRYRAWVRPGLRGMNRSELRELVGYGARIQATNAAAAVHDDTDRILLGGFFSTATVAPFDVGWKLISAMRMAPSLALTALFPAAATLQAAGRRAALDRIYLAATRYVAAVSCLSAAVLIVTAGPLVELWMGRPLPFAVTTIVLLAPAYALNLSGGPAAAVTRAEGAPGRETRYGMLAVGVNVALTVPLLALLGPTGVPLATSIAIVVSTAYFFWHFHRDSGRPFVPLINAVWKQFAAASVAVGFTMATIGLLPYEPGRGGAALAVLSRGATGVLLVVGLLTALRFFDGRDRDLLRGLHDRLRRAAPLAVSPPGGRP